jgi:hypothetical protein
MRRRFIDYYRSIVEHPFDDKGGGGRKQIEKSELKEEIRKFLQKQEVKKIRVSVQGIGANPLQGGKQRPVTTMGMEVRQCLWSFRSKFFDLF